MSRYILISIKAALFYKYIQNINSIKQGLVKQLKMQNMHLV